MCAVLLMENSKKDAYWKVDMDEKKIRECCNNEKIIMKDTVRGV